MVLLTLSFICLFMASSICAVELSDENSIEVKTSDGKTYILSRDEANGSRVLKGLLEDISEEGDVIELSEISSETFEKIKPILEKFAETRDIEKKETVVTKLFLDELRKEGGLLNEASIYALKTQGSIFNNGNNKFQNIKDFLQAVAYLDIPIQIGEHGIDDIIALVNSVKHYRFNEIATGLALYFDLLLNAQNLDEWDSDQREAISLELEKLDEQTLLNIANIARDLGNNMLEDDAREILIRKTTYRGSPPIWPRKSKPLPFYKKSSMDI